MLAALGNVNPSHLLDPKLLAGIVPQGTDPTLNDPPAPQIDRAAPEAVDARRRLPIAPA